MNHTSGIPDYWQYDVYNQKDSIYHFLTLQDKLEFETNSEYRYCNISYFLLGEIIEKISEESFQRFMDKIVFTPLDMSNSLVNNGARLNRAIGYDESWNKNDYLMTTADGGILSTVEDLYKFDQALCNGKILNTNYE